MKSLFTKAIAVLAAGIIATSAFTTTGFAASEELRSDSFSVAYEGSVYKPTYSIKGTTGSRSIKLSCKTSGATIYYTTDGTAPTKNSTKYTGLINITKATKIRAIAISGSSKSAIMSKTVKVTTLVGDVTGDGTINNNDYNRLKSYLNGDTSYICKDNADTSGDGSIKNKDLSLLKQYLNEEITSFPKASGSTSTGTVPSPTSSTYRVYDGKKIVFSCSDSDATIYYTLNGSKPTTASFKYTEALIVNTDSTIRYIAYKDGKYSKSKTKTVTVDECAAVTSNQDTNKNYTEKLEVKLSCATGSSKIYYTTDGTDPETYGKLYSGALTLTQDTTIKAYSRCKGYSDSDVMTFQYKVKVATYSISGVVWNDTVAENSVADGIRQSNETGINGITVYLLNTATNAYEKTAVTSTINGVLGSYSFDNLTVGNYYKVVFMYNGQKYRAYDSVVTNGNQAISTSIPSLSISNKGSTNTATNYITSSINNYAAATTSNMYNSTATTSATYNNTTANVNLALKTNVYGKLALTMVPSALKSASTGLTTYLSNTTGLTAASGDTLIYVLTLTNNSQTQILNDGSLLLYIDNDLTLQSVTSTTGLINTSSAGTTGLYNAYLVKDFIYTSLGAMQSISFTIVTTVNQTTNSVVISNSAEVASYRYASSCYDANSIPGNMAVGTKRENDEAVSVSISTTAIAKTIAWLSTPQITGMVAGNPVPYTVTVALNTIPGSDNGVFVSSSNTACATCAVTNTIVNGSYTYITITVTPLSIGSGEISVLRSDDVTKSVTAAFSVTA